MGTFVLRHYVETFMILVITIDMSMMWYLYMQHLKFMSVMVIGTKQFCVAMLGTIVVLSSEDYLLYQSC